VSADPRQAPGPSRAPHRGRTLESDLQRVAEHVARWSREAGARVQAAIGTEPYAAGALAIGVGFVLGGGLDRRMRALLLGAGSRFVGSWLAEQMIRTAGDPPADE